MNITPFQFLSESLVYQNPYFSVLQRSFKLPSEKTQHFFILDEVDTCCVLPMTEDQRFICVQEFRVGPKAIMLELPAGRFEHRDDDPDDRIRRELLEETGYTGEFKKVGVLPTSPYGTRKIHVYYATHCKKIAEQQLGENEFISVHLLSKDEMREVLLSGKSSSSAPGLLAWEWMKQDGKL